MHKIAIVIPARYGSTRFPGKPLVKIAGKTMLTRVCEIAKKASLNKPQVEVIVATEDERVLKHAIDDIGVQAFMTSEGCKTGSDRALDACARLDEQPDIVLNLQGDAPLTPPHFLKAIIDALIVSDDVDVATPVVQLTWEALDNLRERKKITPFGGTTAIIDQQGNALWFSKNIIPGIRREEALRHETLLSPVFQHIGLYGYKMAALKKFVSLPESHYEQLEGLEQLRLLENGMTIKTVGVSYEGMPVGPGVDTPQDAKKAEDIILQYGEIIHD